ncbi:Hsp70 protein [Glycomyces sambucus]|uniref:Hsp70 protein n=1 Tax=Glycomyces sambucus TaxID=380244 RepID=A0A1G9FXG3_9ACTN|nr:Hsp70 family protein [Glycomyces sambucus]SDK92843.1 Hsp70 protein [Glycomyces sambucus]
MSPSPASGRTAIGIDFGTSHTVVSLRRSDGRVQQQLFDGTPQMASALFLDEAEGLIAGADAVQLGARRPERFEPNPKRRIDDGAILLGETEIPVVEALSAVFARVAAVCRHTAGALGPVTVTVPASWGPHRRLVLADAAAAAGLGEVELLAEPVAAAHHFAAALGADVPVGSGIVVYDLGAGTFDVTVLSRGEKGYEVLAADGAEIGGLDLDQALAAHLAANVREGDERWARLLAPGTTADRRHRLAFLTEVRQAKERLSRRSSTDLAVPLLDVDAHLTRSELDAVVRPLVDRTVRVTRGTIRASGLASERIAGLFLVGAASRTPLIATELHRALGMAPTTIEQPELAVSEGAVSEGAASGGQVPQSTVIATSAPVEPSPVTPAEPLRSKPVRVTYRPVPPAGPDETVEVRKKAPEAEPKPRRGAAVVLWTVFALFMLQYLFAAMVQLDDPDYGRFLAVAWAVPVAGGIAMATRRLGAVVAYGVVSAGVLFYWSTLMPSLDRALLLGLPVAAVLVVVPLLPKRGRAVTVVAAGAQLLLLAAVAVWFAAGLRGEVGRMAMIVDFLPTAGVLAAVAAVNLLLLWRSRRAASSD